MQDSYLVDAETRHPIILSSAASFSLSFQGVVICIHTHLNYKV